MQEWFVLLLVLVIIFVTIPSCCVEEGEENVRKEAIRCGAAYTDQTGQFRWRVEVNKTKKVDVKLTESALKEKR